MIEGLERAVVWARAKGRGGHAGACGSGVGIVLALTVVLAVGSGCGQAPASAGGTVPVSLSSTSTSAAAVVPVSPPVTPANIEQTFKALAASVKPMEVFVPTVLPEGATLAARWLPVIGSADPRDYRGEEQPNPRTVGAGPDSEVQVVFQAGSGWLVVIENFHGDLGDVTGTPVGVVAGNPALLYEVNGGELVQWSQDGRWYGLFGRGVSRDAILAAALGMETVFTESPRT